MFFEKPDFDVLSLLECLKRKLYLIREHGTCYGLIHVLRLLFFLSSLSISVLRYGHLLGKTSFCLCCFIEL